MNAIPEYAPPEPIPAPISAVEALVPAFRRARSILAAPFRLGFFLKICFFVALAESGFLWGLCSYPTQAANGVRHASGAMLDPGRAFLAGMGADGGISLAGALGVGLLLIFAAMAVIGIALACIFFYLVCRLRFAILDLAIYRQGSLRRAWRKYGRQTWRYFGLMILAGLVFLLIVAAFAGPFIPALVRIGRTMNPAHPDPFALLGILLPMVAVIVLLSLLAVVVEAVIRDFLLPPMAIEDASLESALRRFSSLLRKSAGSMALYFFLRTLVSIALTASLAIVLLLPVALLALLALAVGVPIYHSLGTSGAQVLFVAYVAVAAALLLPLYFLAMVTIHGVTGVFKLCYAVVFFGARYPALGNLLEPPQQRPPAILESPPPPPPGNLPILEPPPVW